MNLADASIYVTEGSYEESLDWIGREVTREAPYPVNEAQIGYYCALVEDTNENYWDLQAAQRRFGSLVSPPGMLLVWVFPLPWLPTGRPEHGPILALEVPLPGRTLINVATTTTFHAPMRVGTRLGFREQVTAISPPKETALGVGHFVTTLAEVTDDEGTHVATNENVLYRYEAQARQSAPAAAQPAVDVAGSSELPVVTMPVTLGRCVLNAAATRDFFPGHHDRDYARSQGARDVYLNTMFFQGLVDRVITDWAGPDTWVTFRRLSMVAPACVGDLLSTSGRVTAEREEHGRRIVDAEVTVRTEHGPVAIAELTTDLDGWQRTGSDPR